MRKNEWWCIKAPKGANEMSDDIKYKKCCNCDTLVSVHPLIVTPVYCDECYIGSSTLKKQAATIASLRVENDRLRKALQAIDAYPQPNNYGHSDVQMYLDAVEKIIREALGGSDGK